MTIFFHGKRHQAVIAYDVSANSTRRRVFRILKDWKIDGQKSLVECRLSETEAEELFLQLSEEMDLETDRLALVWLDVGSTPLVKGKHSGGKQAFFHWL